MTIRPAPIRQPLIDARGAIANVWSLWFNNLVQRVNVGDGVSGTFTTTDGKTITITNGIVTDIT